MAVIALLLACLCFLAACVCLGGFAWLVDLFSYV